MTTPPMTSTLSSQPSLPISDITPPASRGLSTLACFPVTLFMLPIYLTPFTGSQRVTKEVVDRRSPAWNKGRIYYSSASDEVIEAYSAQFTEDMAQFLQARAEEIADGGLMIIIFPARPAGWNFSFSSQYQYIFRHVGSLPHRHGQKGKDIAVAIWFIPYIQDFANIYILITFFFLLRVIDNS